MAEAVNPEKIVETVSAANLKVLGETPAFHENIAQKDLLGHRYRLSLLGEAATALAIGKILNTSPTEGGVDVAALMQLMKGAQTTPPVTAKPSE